MTQPGTCAQCGCSCDPDYRLCDECGEIEDDASQNHCAQCGCSIPPDDRLCDECQAFADEADEADEGNERTRDEERGISLMVASMIVWVLLVAWHRTGVSRPHQLRIFGPKISMFHHHEVSSWQ
jgi:predicted nucleic acid-binding Zn ribbon protein